MHPRFLLAFAPLLLATTAASPRVAARAQADSAPAASGRPVILVVHGRGHVGRDSGAVRRSAQAALVAGLEAQGLPAGAMVQDGDVRMVWYADVAGAVAGAELAGAASACGPATDLIGQGSDFALVAGFLGVLLDAAGGLEGAPELRELRADIRYIADPRVQCEAERRLDAAVMRALGERRPVIVVAHSMGALVTWGYLQRRDAGSGALPEIARLVTVGSPLGSPDVRAMVFGDARAPLQLPRGVAGWVNLMDPDDPFAAPITQATAGAATGGRGLATDAWTRGGRANPHELEGYLRDPAGAGAVAAAWCEAADRLPHSVKRSCGASP